MKLHVWVAATCWFSTASATLTAIIYADCDANTFCLPIGHWPGGQGSCSKGKCMCRGRIGVCSGDQECCSGKCTKHKCELGREGDICNFLDNKFWCQSPFVCHMAMGLPPTIGTCSETPRKDLSSFSSDCYESTRCAPIGNWPGGFGNCFDGKCLCRVKEDCGYDHQCCSGTCNNGVCKPGDDGDVCVPYSCGYGIKCTIPAHDLNVASLTNHGYGSCAYIPTRYLSPRVNIGAPCDAQSRCVELGHWIGGKANCFEGKCLCRTDESCKFDYDCCSGDCSNGRCAKGAVGDLCKGSSCDGLDCQRPSHDKNVNNGFPDGGICTGAPAKRLFGQECHREVKCESVGHWPGGLGNCVNGVCGCTLTAACQKDRECCSGRCLRSSPAKGFCISGRFGDVCVELTCGVGYYCQIPLPYPYAFPNYDNKSFGICLETSPYGSACDAESFCQPLSHWPGGKGNCLEGKCACRLGECDSDAQCCSGKCTSGICELGKLNTMCNQTSCASGLTCGIDTVRWTETFRQTRGLCMEFVPFGSICNESTVCQPNASWPGGLGNCVNSRCRCHDKNNCERNEQCCSGHCADSKCQLGKSGDFCIDHTMCDSSNLCAIPPRNTSMESESWGVCTKCSALTSSCDSETFCCATSSWPGGRGNCFAGKCHCRFLTECTRDWQCCTNRCKKGRCQLGQRGQMCTNDLYNSCDGKLICANNSEAGDIGICADCFAVGADCKVDNVCCSGVCKEGKCS